MELMEFFQALNEIVPSVGVGAIIVFGWKINGSIGELRGQIAGLSVRMSKVETEIHSINGSIGELRGQIAGLDSRLFKVETEIHSINDYLRRA